MSTSAVADPLFDIKNSFYIGNYQFCINECQKFKYNDAAQRLEGDIFMYWSYIVQRKYGVVIREITSSSPPELQHLQMLATYCGGDIKKKKQVVDGLEKSLQNIHPNDKLLPLIAGFIYYLDENYDAVLKLLQKSENLGWCALAIQTCLKINRVDLAVKELASMKEIDEDCTLTQLSQAWVNLHKNDAKLQVAFYIFQELSDKFSPTPMLLNGQVAALIALGKYEEAEPLLQEALDKDSDCPETLINMIVLSQHMGKSIEVTKRHMNQLRDCQPDHPFFQEYDVKEQDFNRLAKMYAVES